MLKVPEDEFIALWDKYGSASKIAKILDIGVRSVYSRRKEIERRTGKTLISTDPRFGNFTITYPGNGVRAKADIDSGVIMVASDCHYYPGIISTAHKAFVHLVKELKPKLLVMNGDVFDGASASRYDPIGWQQTPTVKQELEACHDRLAEIEEASKSAILHWTWGNHDMRFNTRLASQVGSAFEGVKGFNLSDHFPRWKFSTSLMVNEHTMIKHRWHNGIHAIHNNVLKSGCSFVTGHLHSLKITPWTDFSEQKTRYGVDTGTLANIDDPGFDYAEDNPKNWRSGFAVLTFWEGKLMPPELCEVISEGLVYFRGQVIQIP
jgi:predicted phosphodiesterase